MDPKAQAAFEHLAAGRFAQAKALLAPLLQRRPDDFNVLAALAECCAQLGEYPQAEFHTLKAARLRPADPAPWHFLFRVGVAAGDAAKAEAAIRKAVEVAPADPEGWRTLAWILQERNQYAESRAAAERGIALAPHDDDLRLKQGNAVRAAGRSAEAAQVFRAGVEACPGSVLLAVGHAYALNFIRGIPPAEVLDAHRRLGRLMTQAAARAGPPLTARAKLSWRPGARPLRVGLISPDLRRHSVAYFVRPLLEHHDRSRIRLSCFAVNTVSDDVTARLRGMIEPGDWVDLPRLPPRELAQRLREADQDVLIELSGHTGGSSLEALAHRPAPVQISHIGYPATTGLEAIDVRIVDSVTDPLPPLGPEEPVCTERLLRLDPCFTCYSPPDDAPPLAAAPRASRARQGPVVFGSFNMLTKLNDDLFALWAQILRSTSGSRLLLKCRGLEHAAVRADVASRLTRAGASMDAIELRGPTAQTSDHLSLYGAVDIALDTSPYCGTTTTCEALLMGVPVVTLSAAPPWHPAVHVGRVGASLLTAAGCPELVAHTPDEYIRLAVQLAADQQRLNDYRTGLRSRLLASTLCDGRAYANRLMRGIADLCESFAS